LIERLGQYDRAGLRLLGAALKMICQIEVAEPGRCVVGDLEIAAGDIGLEAL
jgi:hypothetical protein